jgi:hypothetical protein
VKIGEIEVSSIIDEMRRTELSEDLVDLLSRMHCLISA